MRVTQQDIARIANVSQATVSRVLAGDAKVELSIRDRVTDVMQKHNYRPDVRARSLRSQRTGLIGLVIHRPSRSMGDDPFFSRLISEIVDRLAGEPFHLCLDMVAKQSEPQSIYDEMLRTRRVDGLILVESEVRDARIHRLQVDRFPFVLIGNPLEFSEIYSVDNDNELAGELATRHLLSQGYQKIGFLAGRDGITVSEDRIAGYLRCMKGHGLKPQIWHSAFGSVEARQTARAIFEGPSRPDSLVVLDDFMAMGVVLAARDCGLRIPHDLAVVGFNNSNICDLLECGLTSVSLNINSLVNLACNKLIAVIDSKLDALERRTIVPCELQIRGSSIRQVGT